MESGQVCMIWFCFGEESKSWRRVRVKQPKLNLVTVDRDSSFISSCVVVDFQVPGHLTPVARLNLLLEKVSDPSNVS